MTMDNGSKGNPVDRHIGQRLQGKRQRQMLSLDDCAAQLDMTPTRLADCEAGRRRLQPGEMLRAARLLDVPIVYFFEGGDRAVMADEKTDAVSRFLAMPGAQELASTFAKIESSASREMIVSFAALIMQRENTGQDGSGASSPKLTAQPGREPRPRFRAAN